VTESRQLGEVFALSAVCVSCLLLWYQLCISWYIQVLVHLLECAVGLLEEIVDYAFAEFTLILVVVHLEDLLKGGAVDVVAELWEIGCGALLTLQELSGQLI